MKIQEQSHASIGDNLLSKHGHCELGASLLELMALMLIVAIVAISTMPLLHEQIAVRQIESIARRFIAHAQFARQQALNLGEPVQMAPYFENQWDSGWVVKSACANVFSKKKQKEGDINGYKEKTIACAHRAWVSYGQTTPIYFKHGNRHFIDPHLGKAGILFNAAGAAKTSQGGFVANRLVLGHQKMPGLERHIILSSGGRWRICDPRRDAKRCH